MSAGEDWISYPTVKCMMVTSFTREISVVGALLYFTFLMFLWLFLATTMLYNFIHKNKNMKLAIYSLTLYSCILFNKNINEKRAVEPSTVCEQCVLI